MATPKLRAYRGKRDFSKTAEPSGGAIALGGDGGNRFVVHKHHATADHYDLRLQVGDVLKSWAVPKGPVAQPGRQAAGGRDRGSSARIYRLRGRHSRRRIWRRADDRLGHRRVGADGGCREEPVDRRLQIPAGRRQAERRLDAGAAEAQAGRGQEQEELAVVQGARSCRERRDRHPHGTSRKASNRDCSSSNLSRSQKSRPSRSSQGLARCPAR